MRRGRGAGTGVALVVAAALVVGAMGGGATAVAAPAPATDPGQAAPTCVPSAPRPWGSWIGRVTVAVARCAAPAGVTGYEVLAYRVPSTTAFATDQAGLGTNPAFFSGLDALGVYRFRTRATGPGGAGPLSGWSDAAVPPYTSTGDLVQDVFGGFTGREATAAEVSGPAGRIQAGQLLPEQYPVDLLSSRYTLVVAQVVRLYEAYFRRAPDEEGLRYWADRARTGTSLASISQGFARAPEFTTLYGPLSERAFVELVYTNVLGRPGDEAGIAYWTSTLTARTRTRGEVMVGFSESPENRAATAPEVDVVTVFFGLTYEMPEADVVAEYRGRPRDLAGVVMRSYKYGRYLGRIAAPQVENASLPRGKRGAAYAATLYADGAGGGSIFWEVTGLPPGLRYDDFRGTITGTPTQAGTRTLAVTVSEVGAGSATRILSLTVDP